jgi:hypothetical protein
MLVYFCFLLITALALKFKIAKTFSGTVLSATLVFGGVVVFITETLSLFHAINVVSLSLSWGLLSGICLFLLLRNKKETLLQFSHKKSFWIKSYKSLSWYEKAVIWFIPAWFSLLLFQGIIYPPNNWDSLTYHMSRIMYWIGNGSVSHFPTHIFRLLYQPPFAEFLIMNINLINGNDYLSNSVQLFYLGMSAFGVYAILRAINIPRPYRLLGVFLLLTIPSAELQATTAKNDIVCGFFLIASIYFCIQFYNRYTVKNFIFLGLSIGLTMLTKGTAYVYLTPLLAVFIIAVITKMIQTRNILAFYHGLGAILIVLILNIGHFSRNYKVNGSIISVENYETKTVSNDIMNGSFFVSNLLKNAGLHLGYPVNAAADSIIRKIHTGLKVSIDDPRTNYIGYKYEVAPGITTHEDYVPNTIQFFLLNISFLVIVFYSLKNLRKNKSIAVLAAILFLQILLFSFILKWQPWHTRLHIPMFLFSAAVVSSASFLSKWFRYLAICCIPIILFNFCFYFLYNELRPIVGNPKYTKSIKLSDVRLKKYFSNQLQLYTEYSEVIDKMYAAKNLKKIGLMVNDWEYPLLHDLYYDKITVLAINTANPTSKIFQDTKNTDVIISDHENKAFIDFEGRKYYNQTPNHLHLWIYE